MVRIFRWEDSFCVALLWLGSSFCFLEHGFETFNLLCAEAAGAGRIDISTTAVFGSNGTLALRKFHFTLHLFRISACWEKRLSYSNHYFIKPFSMI